MLVYGDSLSAAYNLPRESGWVYLLGQELAKKSPPWQVINASVSGETSAGGLTRLPATLARHKPKVVILELGANDGLRGLSIADLEKNMAAMIKLIQASKAEVHLVGIRLPINYGPAYTEKFAAIYPRLAQNNKTGFTPFLLAPVAYERKNFMEDGLHPIAAVQPQIAKLILGNLKLK